jgi:wobble nucleotide-excising tRNase
MTGTIIGITKINKINNAGIFSTYSWPANAQDLSFKKINIVYGYNGSGKTTLSNIIGLFSEEFDDLAIKRIELGLAADPSKSVEIEIEWDNKVIKHTKDRKKLYVFNSAFVADHVYDGTQAKVKSFKQVVTTEQLSNPALKKIEEAITLEITNKENAEKVLNTLNNLFEKLKTALSQTWNDNIEGKRMPSIKFENCPQQAPQDNEEDLLKSLEDEFSKFKASKNQEAINRAMSDLNQIIQSFVSFPDGMANTIVKSITETAREKVQDKIDALKAHALEHTSIQSWLEDGAGLLRQTKDDKTCPLCDSTLPNIEELIASYDAFFNEELSALMEEIGNFITTLEGLQTESQNKKTQSMLVKTLLAEYSYQDMVTEDEKSALSRLENETIKNSINTVKTLFESKKKSIDFIPTEEQQGYIQILTQAAEQFSADAKYLISVKDKILNRLQSASFNDKNAKNTCEQLLWKRFDNQGKEVATDVRKNQEKEGAKLEIPERIGGVSFYWVLKQAYSSIQTRLTQREEEKEVGLSKLKKESEYVNEFLARFGINNFIISTQDDEEITVKYPDVPPKKGIQYSISEGEKTALAFAYFLSKYRHEVLDNPQAKKEEFTIVIDDPVSSLDENRLFSTALVIQDMLMPQVTKKEKSKHGTLLNKAWDGCKQIIILSHNIIFLKFMSNLIDSDQCRDRADLYIEKGTISLLPDSLMNYQTSYFQKLGKIQAYIDGNIKHEHAKDYLSNYIRVVLEAFLSFKFARLKNKDNKFLPAMLDSLIGQVTSDETLFDKFTPVSGITNSQTLRTILSEIKQKTNPESHGTTQDITHFEYLSEAELKKLAKQTLYVIQFLDQIHFRKAQELKQVV